MASYLNGKRISGIRDFPAYTWAEYHALPAAQRPKVWKCTDRDYTEIPVFKRWADATGSVDINLPSKWQEIIINCSINNYSDAFSIPVCWEQAAHTSEFKTGAYYGGNYYFYVNVLVTQSKVKLMGFWATGTDDTSIAKTIVYYR